MLCYVFITGQNEVLAKVIFLHLSVILFTGGVWQGDLPPQLDGEPSPPQLEEPPRLEGEPLQLDGEPTPPQLEGEPPGWMENPLRLDGEPTPPGWKENPPREADPGIRSTIGRYASYWNAFLYYVMYLVSIRGIRR